MRLNGILPAFLLASSIAGSFEPRISSICSMADDDEDPDEGFTKKFNKLFHAASKERETRLKKDLMKEIDGSLSTKLEAFTETIKESMGSLLADRDLDRDDPNPNDDDDAPPERQRQRAGGSDLSPEALARLKQAEQKAKEASEKADKWQKQAEEEAVRTLRADERSTITSLLSGKVKPALLEMVAEQLHKNVVRDEPDENGKRAILFKGADGLLPVKDGIDIWSKSDQGKEVAPARQVGGSGGRGDGTGGHTAKGEMTMEGLGAIVAGSTPGARG